MKNIIGWFKTRNILMKKKEEEYKEYLMLKHKFDDLMNLCGSMLIVRKKLKIIKGETENDIENKYNEFYKSLKQNGDGRLGGIWSIDEPNFDFQNGYLCTIKYSVFELREEFTHEDYQNAITKIELLYPEYDVFRKKYGDI